MTLLNNGILLNSDRLFPETPAWSGHIPFAGWLMNELKPAIFVELGTHKGVSYSAFCHAVLEAKLVTKCYAVDTWKGDVHACFYDDSVYLEFADYDETYFAEFSQLMRMTFDEALPYFSEGSIDLLHIDGLHTYEAVRHDFDTWLPKMSQRGIILLHDINVRKESFGVWKLWEEVSHQYPSITFNHSCGLGMLLVGQDVPKTIYDLLQNDTWAVNQLFPHLGKLPVLKTKQIGLVRTLKQRDQEIQQLNQVVGERDQELQRLSQVVHERIQEIQKLNQVVGERDQELQRLSQVVHERIQEIQQLNQVVGERDQELQRLSQVIGDRDQELQRLNHIVAEYKQRMDSLGGVAKLFVKPKLICK